MAALRTVGAGRNAVVVTGAGLLTVGVVASGFRAVRLRTAVATRLAALGTARSADAVDAPTRLR